jgi:MFS family permease
MSRPDPLQVYIVNQSCHWFIVGLIFPIMALLFLEKGADIFQVGALIAAYSATVILLELPTGGLADSIGRKRVYLISLGFYAMALVTVLFVTALPLLFIGMILMGTARALSSGSMDAWFVDEFKRERPDQDLQRALAKANTLIPVGIASGAFIGGLLPYYLGPEVDEAFGLGVYSINLMVMLIAVAAQALLTSVLVREERLADGGDAWSGVKGLPQVLSASVQYGLKNRTILLLLISVAALGFSLMTVETYWQPRLKEILGGDSEAWIFGAIAAGYFLANSVGNLVSIPLCARFKEGRSKALAAIRLVMGGALVLLAVQGGVWGFAAVYLLFFLMVGVEGSPFAALFNSNVPSEKRSTLLSLQSLVLQVGGLIGTLVMGYVAQTYSFGTAWTLAGLVLMLSALTFWAIPAAPESLDKEGM